MELTRRNFLKFGALGATAAATVGSGLVVPFGSSARTATASLYRKLPTPFSYDFLYQKALPFTNMVHPTEGPYKLFEVAEQSATAQIIKGVDTPVWAYNGVVPGQYVEVNQGEKVKLRIRNALPATHPQFGHEFTTSTHLHGSASLPQFDGYASDITAPTQYKDYWYPNWQNARTLWFHDHGVHHTAENAYGGLAAQYILHDDTERNLLPQGEYDVKLTITDAQFAANGSLSYDDHTRSGLWGDVILVNGVPWPKMNVKQRVYRFRMLCAGISRSYNFKAVVSKTVTDGPAVGTVVPMHIVATDGGLTPKPIQVQNYRHAGAERYEWLLDLRKVPTGVQIELRNSSNANNIDYTNTNKVMRFDVVGGYDASTDPQPGTNTIPGTLDNHEVMGALKLANGATVSAGTPASTTLRVERSDLANEWRINQQTWGDVIESGYSKVVTNVPKDGDVQVWDIVNNAGGWFHPVHIHLVDFRILARRGGAGKVLPQEGGPKDVAYIGEGETVKVAAKFRLNPDAASVRASWNTQGRYGIGNNAGGRYMVHCHNLPHEDHDMMVQFSVQGQVEANHPVNAALPEADTGGYDDGAPAPLNPA